MLGLFKLQKECHADFPKGCREAPYLFKTEARTPQGLGQRASAAHKHQSDMLPYCELWTKQFISPDQGACAEIIGQVDTSLMNDRPGMQQGRVSRTG